MAVFVKLREHAPMFDTQTMRIRVSSQSHHLRFVNSAVFTFCLHGCVAYVLCALT